MKYSRVLLIAGLGVGIFSSLRMVAQQPAAQPAAQVRGNEGAGSTIFGTPARLRRSTSVISTILTSLIHPGPHAPGQRPGPETVIARSDEGGKVLKNSQLRGGKVLKKSSPRGP